MTVILQRWLNDLEQFNYLEVSFSDNSAENKFYSNSLLFPYRVLNGEVQYTLEMNQ